MIATTLIESIWKDKLKTENIKETIQEAYNEINRGKFDKIQELDEEQLYNSLMNSGSNTEWLKSEVMVNKANGYQNKIKENNSINEFRKTVEEDSNLLNSDNNVNDALLIRKDQVYRQESTKSNEHTTIEYQDPINEHMDKNEFLRKFKEQDNNSKPPKNINYANVKVMDIHDTYEEERLDTDENNNNEIEECLANYIDDNSSSATKQPRHQQNISASILRNRNKRYMRSFDKAINSKPKQPIKVSTFRNEHAKHKKLVNATHFKDNKINMPYLKDQYHTITQNTFKKDSKHFNTKIDIAEQKFKQILNNSRYEYNLRLPLHKMHARNRSANSLSGRFNADENFSSKDDQHKTTSKKIIKKEHELQHVGCEN